MDLYMSKDMEIRHSEHIHEHCHEHHHVFDEKNEHEMLITVSEHDSAIIGNVKCKLHMTAKEAVERVKESIRNIAEKIAQNGGYIGHIKGILKESGGMHHLSMVDETYIDYQYIGNILIVDVECVFIVFGVEKNTFAQWLRTELEKTLSVL